MYSLDGFRSTTLKEMSIKGYRQYDSIYMAFLEEKLYWLKKPDQSLLEVWTK